MCSKNTHTQTYEQNASPPDRAVIIWGALLIEGRLPQKILFFLFKWINARQQKIKDKQKRIINK